MHSRPFLRRSTAEQALLVRAAALLAVVRAGLWGLRFATVRTLLERGSRWHAIRAAPAERLVWAVRAAARRMRGTSCLAEALAVRFLLARHGHPAVLRVSVAHDTGGALRAHVWVESAAVTVDCGATALDHLAVGAIAELPL